MDKDAIEATAHERAVAQGLPYTGALTPAEAHALREAAADATIIDVRTDAELSYVGRIPGALEIEWLSYPGREPNANFIAELKEAGLTEQSSLLFICRSGVRSHNAAIAAASSGFAKVYNVIEGFEGDLDEKGQRNSVNGWRFRGLPWSQS